MSVSVNYEHLHAILKNPFFIGLGTGQCEHTITEIDKNGLDMTVWRCLYSTETLMPLGTVANVSVSVSVIQNTPLEVE